MPYPALYNAPKALAFFPGWSKPEADTGYSWFNAPLEIGGVVEAGFVLHGGCLIDRPDQHVIFELRATAQQGSRLIPVARVDWRSVSGGHSNRRRAGSPVSGTRVSSSHIHAFELNWIEIERRMRTDLGQAREFDQQIQSFEELRDMVKILFRINNLDIVAPPKWEYTLFHNGQ